MHDKQTADLRPGAAGAAVPDAGQQLHGPRRPNGPRPDLSHAVRAKAVRSGARHPRHRTRRAIAVSALCIAVMSVEFWALNRIPEATPAPEAGALVAVTPLAPPPSSAPSQPSSTGAVVMTAGTREVTQALTGLDSRLPTSGSPTQPHSSKSSSRRTVSLPEKPAPRPDSPRVDVAHATAAAPADFLQPADVSLTNVALPASYKGVLLIDSMPAGARVFVDRELVGFTPVALPNVTAGSRVVRLEADAHEAWSSAVRIVADEQTRLSVQLSRANR
jgi:PEGA domain